MCVCVYTHTVNVYYGVATVGRIDKIVGLFCKRDLLKRQYSAKETYDLIDPTDRSHPVCISQSACIWTHFVYRANLSLKARASCKDDVWCICLMVCLMHSSLQHTATHCNTLQHTATHCNTVCLMMSDAFVWCFVWSIRLMMSDAFWSKETPPPGGVFYLQCSLIKSDVWCICWLDPFVIIRQMDLMMSLSDDAFVWCICLTMSLSDDALVWSSICLTMHLSDAFFYSICLIHVSDDDKWI